MPPGDFAPVFVVTVLALVTGAVMIFRGPLGQAIARRIEGRAAGPSDLEARVGDLEHRLAEADRDRAELLERVEFAERLLLQAKDAGRELPR